MFIFNAMYAGCYFVYALVTYIFTHSHGLIRNYALNEYNADPRFFMLKRWAKGVSVFLFFGIVCLYMTICRCLHTKDCTPNPLGSPAPQNRTYKDDLTYTHKKNTPYFISQSAYHSLSSVPRAAPRILAHCAGLDLLLLPRARPEPRGASILRQGASGL